MVLAAGRWCWFLVADALMVAGFGAGADALVAASCGRCAGFFGAGLASGGRWSMVLVYVLAGAYRCFAGLSGSTGALWWPLVLVALMAADVLVVRW